MFVYFPPPDHCLTLGGEQFNELPRRNLDFNSVHTTDYCTNIVLLHLLLKHKFHVPKLGPLGLATSFMILVGPFSLLYLEGAYRIALCSIKRGTEIITRLGRTHARGSNFQHHAEKVKLLTVTETR